MDFTSRITTAANRAQIINDLTQGQEGEFDFGILFLSCRDHALVADIVSAVRKAIPVKTLVGCTCAGIIGSNDEIERESATVLTLAKLPGVRILPFMMNQVQLEGFQRDED